MRFRWRVEPATPLYRANEFTLSFPDGVDLGRVSSGLWWTIGLGCLAPQWPLLRPCRVRLPVRLPPGEAKVWLRLIDAEVTTIESLVKGSRLDREIEIVESGPLVDAAAVPESGRCAVAFSGGKDSLVHVGLLAELTDRPVLVTITSPMPQLHDHSSARRRHVMREIVERRAVTHLEVTSDYRACWDNAFPWGLGYPIAVNELSDTFLYWGALLAAGVAVGAPHLFLASEAEVQETVALDGRTVQHPHMMYSTITQRALQALVRRAGIRYCSLTSPLHSYQVQQLLWTRYRDLRDLQYSCWRLGPDEGACSRCGQCFRLSLYALALGDTPERMDVDLVRLLRAQRSWRPVELEADGDPPLPGPVVSRAFSEQVTWSIRATSVGRVARAIVAGHPARLADPRSWLALASYARLRRRAASDRATRPVGFRTGFLPLIDPLLRDRVARIYGEHFEPAAAETYAALLDRNHALTRWITEPVGGEG